MEEESGLSRCQGTKTQGCLVIDQSLLMIRGPGQGGTNKKGGVALGTMANYVRLIHEWSSVSGDQYWTLLFFRKSFQGQVFFCACSRRFYGTLKIYP